MHGRLIYRVLIYKLKRQNGVCMLESDQLIKFRKKSIMLLPSLKDFLFKKDNLFIQFIYSV